MRHFFAFMVGVGCLGFLNTVRSQTYDLGLDFTDGVVPSVGIGPDGVWSYGFDFSDVNVTNPVAFTPYTLHGGAPAGPDSYYTNGPASIYQSPPAGGFGIISHDPDVANARSIIRWTAPSNQTIYIDGSSWKFVFDIGNGRKQDFYVRKNSDPASVAGTTSDASVNDGSGVTPGTETHWKIDTTVNAGDTIDIIYLRHPGYIQDFIGFTETITVVPNGSPLITSQPASLEAEPGGTATFALSATGNPPLSYQWFKNGSVLSGATSPSLTIANAGASDQGTYSVVVSNSVNARTSVEVVLDPMPAPSNVHDVTAEFSLASNPTARGWRYSESVASGGGGIGRPVINDWNAPDFGPGQPGWQGGVPGVHAGYAKRINNGTANGFDAPVGTVMTHGPTSVLWQAPPDDTNRYCYLKGGLWNLRHLGRSGVWNLFKNGTLLSSGNIDDTSGTSSSPLDLATGSGGADALVASYVPGDNFRLEMLEGDFQGLQLAITTTNVAPDPFISAQPQSQTVPQGATATFSVTASGSSPLSYEWILNGTTVVGTNASLTIPDVQPANTGNYKVRVTSPAGARTSVTVSLAISPQQPAGTPWDLAGDWKDSIIPPVNIGPEAAWSYGYSPIPSANNYFAPFNFTPYPFADCTHGFVGCPSYDITPDVSDPAASTAFAGTFVKSHTSGAANFQPIIFRWTARRPITVNASGTTWTDDQNGRTQDYFVRKNSNAQFFASGTVDDSMNALNPLTWSTNGISLNPGDYIDLIVRRTPGAVQSFIEVAEQIVEAPVGTPHISIHPSPASQIVAAGSTVTYSVTASGSGLSYQWRLNGAPVAGANTASLTINSASPNDAGTYTVLVSNGTGDTTSDGALLTVDATPPTVLSATRSFLILNQVNVLYSEPVQPGGATNIDDYTMNNGNHVTGATLDAGLTRATLMLANNIANDQPQILTVNGVRDTVGNLIAANTVVTVVVPSDVVRLQDSSANHLLVLEAEDYNLNLSPSGGNSWVFTNAPGLLQPTDANTNFSGTGVMSAEPNLANNRGTTLTGPELDYKVQFVATGTNYVWVRGVGDSAPGPSQNDSILIGIDGALTTLLTGFPQGQGYSWGNTPSGPIVVNTTGLHVINVWMREDGFAFDKLLLSSNPTFNPTGIGPAESPVPGPAIAVTMSAEGNLILTWQGGGVLQSAPSITSTFSDIAGSSSPYRVVPAGTQQFYRVKQ